MLKRLTKTIKQTTKKATEFVDKVINGRDSLGPNIIAILKQYGDIPIIGIIIGRHPLAGVLVGAIDTVSAFQFKKNIANSPYHGVYSNGGNSPPHKYRASRKIPHQIEIFTFSSLPLEIFLLQPQNIFKTSSKRG